MKTTKKAKREVQFHWNTSHRGNRWLRLRNGKNVTVNRYEKRDCWSYSTDLDATKKGQRTFVNGFASEREAMLAAEAMLGEHVVAERKTRATVLHRDPVSGIETVRVEPEEADETRKSPHLSVVKGGGEARSSQSEAKSTNSEEAAEPEMQPDADPPLPLSGRTDLPGVSWTT